MCLHQPKHENNARFSCQQHHLTEISGGSCPVRTAHLKLRVLTNPSREIVGQTPRFLYLRVGGDEEMLILRSYAFQTEESGEINGNMEG
jgi:hypothetical protein